MESWTREYTITGRKPAGSLPTLEIYDSEEGTGAQLPEWLRTKSFSGVVDREREALFVTARQFEGDPARAVVFVQPMDKHWTDQLYERWRTTVRTTNAKGRRT